VFSRGVCVFACVDQALSLKAHLARASQRLYLLSDLHLLYLLTPFCSSFANPRSATSDAESSAQPSSGQGQLSRSSSGFSFTAKWQLWNDHLNAIAFDDHPTIATARLIGIQRSVVQQAALQDSFPSRKAWVRHLTESDYKRFFLALALHEIINEVPLAVVSDRFGFRRGDLQRLQAQASMFAKQALTFCFHLKWERIQLLLQGLEESLNFGAQVRPLTQTIDFF